MVLIKVFDKQFIYDFIYNSFNNVSDNSLKFTNPEEDLNKIHEWVKNKHS